MAIEPKKDEKKYGLDDFIKDYKDQIAHLMDALTKRYAEEPKLQFQFTALVLFVVLVVVGAVVYLGSIKVLTDNTISFILGSVIGYIFSFLGDLLPNKE